jgi:hypothetical protein
MKNNTFLLIIGSLLLVYGLFVNLEINKTPIPNSSPVVVAPLDPTLKISCEKVITVFKEGSSDRNIDCIKLSNLYNDLAKLIALDNNNEIIKNTDEIRDANRLAGLLYNLDLKGKYPGLAEAANNVIVNYIGNDNVVLDKNLRDKAVEAFKGLAWACYEGSK